MTSYFSSLLAITDGQFTTTSKAPVAAVKSILSSLESLPCKPPAHSGVDLLGNVSIEWDDGDVAAILTLWASGALWQQNSWASIAEAEDPDGLLCYVASPYKRVALDFTTIVDESVNYISGGVTAA